MQVENHQENAKVSDSLDLELNPSEEYFDLPRHKEIAIEYDIPLFVSVRDSMMYELLGRRRNVALPLDFLKVTSDYGYRADPFTKCSRWHSGVDLRAKYAHLSFIAVKEGQIVSAGTIVGISGRSGRATAEHLHLEISKWNQDKQGGSWEKVDPEPFLSHLNNYIVALQQKMDTLHLRIGYAENMESYNAKVRAIAKTL